MGGQDVSIEAVEGSQHGDGGVASGALLLRFVEAVLSDASNLPEVRTEVVATLGGDVMADASGVIATFEMMNRVANATGTPLDEGLVAQTEGVRSQLDLTHWESHQDL